MLTMNEDLEGALRDYLELLDAEKYFEAHEVLEEAWHPLRLQKHPLANLVKGLINGAVSFEHIKRHKNNYAKKAYRVIASYERHKHLCKRGVVHYELFALACKKIESLKNQHREIFS